jgi:hypothetical protein
VNWRRNEQATVRRQLWIGYEGRHDNRPELRSPSRGVIGFRDGSRAAVLYSRDAYRRGDYRSDRSDDSRSTCADRHRSNGRNRCNRPLCVRVCAGYLNHDYRGCRRIRPSRRPCTRSRRWHRACQSPACKHHTFLRSGWAARCDRNRSAYRVGCTICLLIIGSGCCLFMPQSPHRVHACRAPRGNPACRNGHADQQRG